jgi:hypothetical protein
MLIAHYDRDRGSLRIQASPDEAPALFQSIGAFLITHLDRRLKEFGKVILAALPQKDGPPSPDGKLL